MSTEERNYGRAAKWILLSPLLFIMASISTVESLTTYYIQLVCFSIVSIAGIATGIGFIFGWPWANISAKYISRTVVVIFVGIPLLIVLFIAYKLITGV